MKKIAFAALMAATLSAAVFAQDAAPDGSRPFGIEPYVGVLGGSHSFDSDSEFGSAPGHERLNGALISGIAGVNVPLGAFLWVPKAMQPRALATLIGNMARKAAPASERVRVA